jgi:hypothetical protein
VGALAQDARSTPIPDAEREAIAEARNQALIDQYFTNLMFTESTLPEGWRFEPGVPERVLNATNLEAFYSSLGLTSQEVAASLVQRIQWQEAGAPVPETAQLEVIAIIAATKQMEGLDDSLLRSAEAAMLALEYDRGNEDGNYYVLGPFDAQPLTKPTVFLIRIEKARKNSYDEHRLQPNCSHGFRKRIAQALPWASRLSSGQLRRLSGGELPATANRTWTFKDDARITPETERGRLRFYEPVIGKGIATEILHQRIAMARAGATDTQPVDVWYFDTADREAAERAMIRWLAYRRSSGTHMCEATIDGNMVIVVEGPQDARFPVWVALGVAR